MSNNTASNYNRWVVTSTTTGTDSLTTWGPQVQQPFIYKPKPYVVPSQPIRVNENTPIIVDDKVITMGEIVRLLRILEFLFKEDIDIAKIAQELGREEENGGDKN